MPEQESDAYNADYSAENIVLVWCCKAAPACLLC